MGRSGTFKPDSKFDKTDKSTVYSMVHVNATESVVQIMDGFDGIYSPVPQAERMKATREALSAKVHEKESPDSYSYRIRTEIVIDEVVKFMEKDGPVTREELVPLFLGILDVTPAENPLRPPTPF